jgi:hypothetical protein
MSTMSGIPSLSRLLDAFRYGPLEHPARLAGDQAKLAQIARIRARAE